MNNKTASIKSINKDMSLMELQNVFGERIRLTLAEDKTPEERAKDNEQSYLIVNLGKQMINNGQLILAIEKLAAQNKSLEEQISYKLIGG